MAGRCWEGIGWFALFADESDSFDHPLAGARGSGSGFSDYHWHGVANAGKWVFADKSDSLVYPLAGARGSGSGLSVHH